VSGRIGAILMAALLVLYLVVIILQALRFLAVDNAVSRGLGIALLLLGVLGAWALIAELLFGLRSERLGAVISAEGDLPGESLPLRPSGRPVRSAADAAFPRYQEAVEADPASWKAWFRLGLAYDACGDRRRARQSIRRAITLSRAESHA